MDISDANRPIIAWEQGGRQSPATAIAIFGTTQE
jgi:hypothetical protein